MPRRRSAATMRVRVGVGVGGMAVDCGSDADDGGCAELDMAGGDVGKGRLDIAGLGEGRMTISDGPVERSMCCRLRDRRIQRVVGDTVWSQGWDKGVVGQKDGWTRRENTKKRDPLSRDQGYLSGH
jgi:hypothetical protein